MTTNVTVSWRQWNSEATFSTTGSAASGYSASQLSNTPLSKPWRSASLNEADTQFGFTLPQLRRIDLLPVLSHNLSRDGEIRRILYRNDVSPKQEVYDSGWVQWLTSVYTIEQVDHDGGNLHDRTYTDEELEGRDQNHPWFIPDGLYADEGLILFRDPTNADGYVQAGMCMVHQAIEFSVNPENGAEDSAILRDEVEEAEGGYEDFDIVGNPETFSGNIAFLPMDEAKAVVKELRRQFSIHTPLFWWPNRDDSLHNLRDAWPGRLLNLPQLQYNEGDSMRVSFTTKELLG